MCFLVKYVLYANEWLEHVWSANNTNKRNLRVPPPCLDGKTTSVLCPAWLQVLPHFSEVTALLKIALLILFHFSIKNGGKRKKQTNKQTCMDHEIKHFGPRLWVYHQVWLTISTVLSSDLYNFFILQSGNYTH